MIQLLFEDITYKIRGACFAVWKEFGGAFKEKVVDRALSGELESLGLKVDDQKSIDIFYKNKKVGSYIPDKIINDAVLVEVKCKPFLTKEDERQFWLYLKGSNYKIGLLVNFGTEKLEIKRRIYDKAREKNIRVDQRSYPHQSASMSGFTLVELIVAVGLFLAIVSISVGSFIQSLRAQRQIAGLIAAQNNIGLVLEQMAREMRTGYNFCHDASGNPLCSGSSELVFTNAAGDTIAYRLNGVSIERGVGGVFQQLTGGNVSIPYLNFTLRGSQNSDGWPPRITVSLGVSSKEAGASGTVLRLQTTVSARTLDS